VALHVNHPRELSEDVRRACARLTDAGIPLLSQSVLLKGVNDHADTLEALMRALVEARIKPYYLHHGDLAPAPRNSVRPSRRANLDAPASCARIRPVPAALCSRHSGGHAKANLAPADIDGEPGSYRLRDGKDCWHAYPLT